MISSRPCLLLSLLLLSAACDDRETEEITVRDFRAPCTGVGVQICFVADIDGERHYLYEPIAGFEQEWGISARLLVERVDVPDPPADGSSFRYELVEVVDTERAAAGSRFSLRINLDQLVEDGAGFAFPDGREVECADAALCADIAGRVAAGASFELELEHPDDPTDITEPLIARAVRDVAP